MENTVLGNRYELLEKIGGGGMAIVYKAKCRLLNRYVAVKILRIEFTNDEEFVKRFIVEAQSAASLSHPNIVSIYDVGHQDNIHYIVMEYIDGITLKDYISKKAPLNWKEAVNISIQICSAIAHAHRNNIVHRDIKPHNIMMTSDGIAKVTDFGIARAVSSTTITMVGSTIGSVHYFSPEQARGGYTDEKSDIYSLGIALYEMVTGKVPFDGETPVAIALKHIQQEADPAATINSNIPKGVNDIISKAMQKDQNKRYQTAQEMLEDLYTVLKDPSGSFVNLHKENDFPTKRIPVINDKNTISEDDNDMKKGGKNHKRKDKLAVWLAAILSIIMIFGVGYIAYKVVMPPIDTSSKDITVGNYFGKKIDDVKKIFDDAQITVNVKNVNDEAEAGTILKQDIDPGKTLKVGGYNTITFTVSLGPKVVTVPNLKNKDYKVAEADIKNLELTPVIEEEYSETVANNLVTRTSPQAGEKVPANSTVTIYKSKGPELKKVKVPDLKGKTLTEAKKELAAVKLSLGEISPADISNPSAKVISQSPAANEEATEETAVSLTFEVPSSPSPRPSVTPGRTGAQIKTLSVALNSTPDNPDKIKVIVKLTPSDTKNTTILFDGYKKQSDFPFLIQVEIPNNGYTNVYIEVDGNVYYNYNLR